MKNPLDAKSPDDLISFWKAIRKELISFIDALSEQQFNSRDLPGWNASEICEHVYLTQFSIARIIPVILKGKFGEDTSKKPDADYNEIIKAFSAPTGVQNPESVTPLSNYGRDECKEKLAFSMSKLEKSLEKTSIPAMKLRGYQHPFLGELNLVEAVWSLALHEQMHLQALVNKLK